MLRRIALEGLESRTLLSTTLPTPTVVANSQVNITGDEGNDSTPTITIDPHNPSKLAAVWVRNDPKLAPGATIFAEFAVSIDGGSTWSAPTPLNLISNPNTSGPVVPFPMATDPSIAFDRNDQLYVLNDQHTSDNTVGALVLNTYDFSRSTPVPVLPGKAVYEWDGPDGAITPTMAVDTNLSTFSDKNSQGQTVTQTDPTAGDVYVAWTSNDTAFANAPSSFNANRIRITASSDGGNTFGAIAVVNSNGNSGPAKLTSPTLTISQGVPGVIPGGQVTVGFDDFNTGATATPPFDILKSNPVSGAVVGAFQSASNTTIGDAVKGAGSGPDIPTATDIPINVNITDPRFLRVSDLNVTLNLTDASLNELSAVLIPPTNSGLQPVTLFNNRTNAAGGTNPGGITGANLGTTTSGIRLGTVFDDQATRSITDTTASAPYTGSFRPEGTGLDAAYFGATPTMGAGGIDGQWILELTDFRNSGTPPPVQLVQNVTLTFTSGLTVGNPNNSAANTTVATSDITIADTVVRSQSPTVTQATAKGIGPGLVLASDNTLGAYSQHQGRIYAAFVGHNPLTGVITNPPDNTDIFLMVSDDGGLTWIDQVQVNDDNAMTDGFSESVPGESGRPQFQPSIGVDQTTGTLVMSWFDTRNDASRARVATYLTYSTDGGNTFSPQVYANVPQTTTDAITGNTVVLGPVPDNQSPGNPNTEGTFGFGTHQGLAVYGGHVYPAWASNQVGGYSGGPDGKALLNIAVATVVIPAGPRIISSTQGPVGDPGDTLNNTRTSDGTPIVSAFDVTFDRPVDPSSFTPNLVQVFFHDTTANNATGGLVPVTSVVPLNTGPLGATEFQVNFSPRSAVGTYSYAISPGVRDRIRTSSTSVVPAGTTLPPFNSTDGPIPLPAFNSSTNQPGVINSTIAINKPSYANQVVSNLTVTLNIMSTNDADLILTLIGPDGTPITLYNGAAGFGATPVNFVNTTFDDSAARSITRAQAPYTSPPSYRPFQALVQLHGKPINGTWTLEIQNKGLGSTTTYTNWSLSITPGTVTTTTIPGNEMDQNANGVPGESTGDVYSIPTPVNGTPFVAPFVQTTLPLIIPGPHVISSHVPGAPVTSNNLVQNSSVSAIDVTFDRNMNPATFTPAQVLTVIGPSGAVPGPYTVTPNPLGTDPDPLHPRTYRIGFTPQTTSGSYTITLSSLIEAVNGNKLDTNENAGLSLLLGTAPLGQSTPSTFSNTTATPIVNNGTITSTVTVPTSVLVQGLTVSLDITYPNDPDLQVFLMAPDGTSIELIKNAGIAGASANFSGTILDDAASTSIQNATAPYTGRFQPFQALSTFNGKNAAGTWTLSIQNGSSTVLLSTLNSWSLTVQPPSTTSYNAQITGGLHIPDPSGTVTQPLTSTINVVDSFPVQAVSVELNITHANDPDLEAYLVAPDGTTVQLFKNVGSTGTHANFTNTVFADSATTAIQAGSAPFFGSFQPAQAGGFLQALVTAHAGGPINANGVWTLKIIDDTANGITGTLNSWSLSLTKDVPIDGLGEPTADQAAVSFQIYTTSATSAQSSTSWTAIGPTSIGDGTSLNGYAGRVSSIAVDPSDASGNTVYAAGASGGVWKTTNFLTTSSNGPTWIPLTDFGPTSGLNIGSIAVFGRNDDPKQSIIIAATGEANSSYGIGGNTTQGVGFLRSMDGGQTWTLLDSSNNNLPYASRDHLFAQTNPSLGTVAGVTTAYKVVVDPHPTPNGNVIIYAALGGLNGGLWRSVDTGNTWQKLSDDTVQGKIATDVILDLDSATVNALSNPTGNVNTIYVAFQTAGTQVYSSPNRGQTLNPMTGSNFDAFIQEADILVNGFPKQVPLANAPNPLGGGRVTLAAPSPVPSTTPNADVINKIYENWLYAAVATPSGTLAGLFMTKDGGATWTQVNTPSYPVNPTMPLSTAVPTNDPSRPNYDVISSSGFPQGNYTISLAVDPLNPNIVYFGGTSDGSNSSGLLRINVTGIYDSHAFVAFDNSLNDGGQLTIKTNGRIQVTNYTANGLPVELTTFGEYLNLIQNPSQPFSVNGSTVLVDNITNFANSGAGVLWTPFDTLLNANATDLAPSTNVHQILTYIDPLTGQTRLIVGDDQGVFTGVDQGDGTLNKAVGNVPVATYSRNGNLQIAQLYSGSAQAIDKNGSNAGTLFYSNGLNVGASTSNAQVLANANLQVVGTTSNTLPNPLVPLNGDHQGTGITAGIDSHGNQVVYQYVWPGFSGSSTNFFQVSVNGGPFVVETTGLIQALNDPQWPVNVPLYPGGVVPGAFKVNPLNASQVIMSSNAGRIFQLGNSGATWQVIGDPNFLDGSYAPALTFGAPDPADPVGALNNFIYAGTVSGNLFVTQTGGGGGSGGTSGNQWTNIGGTAHGLDGSGVMQIITNPTRGSHEAYAVTLNGVYHISNSLAGGAGLTWTNITGNLFTILNSVFNSSTVQSPKISYLTGIQADWRYLIPNTTGSGTHPVLYVSANAGVYRSLDNGVTWAPFPAANDPTVPGNGSQPNGGFLPNVPVSSLALVQGNIDPTTGLPNPQPNDPNVLLASTFGRGQFVIRLAPLVFPGTVQLDAKLPAPSGSLSGKDAQGNPIVKISQPVLDGLSEPSDQSSTGNKIYISLVDLTNPSSPRIIGGFDPSNSATKIPANQTSASGSFSIQVNPAAFTTTGIKTIGIYATDPSGTSGNIQQLTINLQAPNLGLPQPPTTPTLALNPFDDSSNSSHQPGQGQNTTNVTLVHLIGTTDPGTSVSLFQVVNGVISGTPVGTATSAADGSFSIPVGPLTTDGSYVYQVEATNSFGTTKSGTFTITIDTHGPTTPPTLSLNPQDDTGVKGDGITSNTQPRLAGVTDPHVFVDLLDSSNKVLATTTSDANGNYSVQLPGMLSNGTITLFTRARDVANNVGPTSASFVLTIVASANPPATPMLQPGSDTGLIGDNVTSVRNPAFNVAGVPAGATLSLFRNGVLVTSVSSSVGGTVAIGDPGPLLDGTYTYTASLVDVASNTSPLSAPLTLSIVTVKGDYTGTGQADLAVARRVSASELDTLIAGGIVPPGGSASFGAGSLDIPFQGDLDGDGKTDLILYRPSTSQWFVQESSQGFVQFNFGGPGDIPLVGDFDGLGHDQLALYRPSTSQWFVGGHAGVYTTFGGPTDIPETLRNYYGNGKDALAVFRPSTGAWYVAGQAGSINFGGPGDIPVPLFNYLGDGRDDLAVFRPSTATWYVGGQATGISFGGPGDIPVAADFDGVGHDEIGVYRPGTGQWFVGGHANAIATFGGPSDIPLSAPYAYRTLPGAYGSINAASSVSASSSGTGTQALSVGLSSTSASTGASSAATTTGSSVVSSSTRHRRPNQTANVSKYHLHDIALASLQNIGKQVRSRNLLGN